METQETEIHGLSRRCQGNRHFQVVYFANLFKIFKTKLFLK